MGGPRSVHLTPPQATRKGWPYYIRDSPGGTNAASRVGPPLAGGPRSVHLTPPQATRKGWPYYIRPLQQRHEPPVYSRATPCGWPAWRSHWLKLTPMGVALL